MLIQSSLHYNAPTHKDHHYQNKRFFTILKNAKHIDLLQYAHLFSSGLLVLQGFGFPCTGLTSHLFTSLRKKVLPGSAFACRLCQLQHVFMHFFRPCCLSDMKFNTVQQSIVFVSCLDRLQSVLAGNEPCAGYFPNVLSFFLDFFKFLFLNECECFPSIEVCGFDDSFHISRFGVP